MWNLIFLDIDGVINNNCCNILLESVEFLKHLIQLYDAKIVIISSLQGNGTEEKRSKIRILFEEFGIYNIDFIDPNFIGSFFDIPLPSRVLGIVDYLKNNEVTNYIILDDEYHNDYRLLCLNHYKTMPFQGLTYKDLPKITFKQVNLNNFKYISYQYRRLGEYELVTNYLVKVLKRQYDNYQKEKRNM